jgi:hypothetical protein
MVPPHASALEFAGEATGMAHDWRDETVPRKWAVRSQGEDGEGLSQSRKERKESELVNSWRLSVLARKNELDI